MSGMNGYHYHINARRWFQKTYGNTYHTVRVQVINDQGDTIADLTSPITYGYGDHYMHTAGQLLKTHGHTPDDFDPYDFGHRKSVVGPAANVTRDVVDVPRRKDLHRNPTSSSQPNTPRQHTPKRGNTT